MTTLTSKKENEWKMEKSIGGHYRLFLNGNLFYEDSAFEDNYEEDSAYYHFCSIIEDFEK